MYTYRKDQSSCGQKRENKMINKALKPISCLRRTPKGFDIIWLTSKPYYTERAIIEIGRCSPLGKNVIHAGFTVAELYSCRQRPLPILLADDKIVHFSAVLL